MAWTPHQHEIELSDKEKQKLQQAKRISHQDARVAIQILTPGQPRLCHRRDFCLSEIGAKGFWNVVLKASWLPRMLDLYACFGRANDLAANEYILSADEKQFKRLM